MQNYTSIEQSRNLLQIGLSPNSADMRYYCYQSLGEDFYMTYPDVIEEGQILGQKDIPCWSTGALINLLPYRLEGYDGEETHVSLEIGKRTIAYVEKFNSDMAETFNEDLPGFLGENLCEAAFKAVVYLKEHKRI